LGIKALSCGIKVSSDMCDSGECHEIQPPLK